MPVRALAVRPSILGPTFCYDEADTMSMGGIALVRKLMLLRCIPGLFESTNEEVLEAFARADLVSAFLDVVIAKRRSSEKPYRSPVLFLPMSEPRASWCS